MPSKSDTLLSMEDALALVSLSRPSTEDIDGWRKAQAALDAWGREQFEKARQVKNLAQVAEAIAQGIQTKRQREQAFTARIERGEVCLPVWEQAPKVGTEFEVVDIAAGLVYVRHNIYNVHNPRTYATRNGRSWTVGNGTADDGVLNVPATFLAWREFCAARKAKAQEVGQ